MKVSMDLKFDTDPNWVQGILENFDAFLADHANMERKAAAMAMSMVSRYPDRDKIIGEMIDIAIEEMEHFRDVYALMVERGIELAKDEPDPYVNQLIDACRHGRDERFIDRMLVASIIECRGAERFRIVSQALEDEQLRTFYRDLWASEAKHGNVFVEMLLEYYEADDIYPRLDELLVIEGQIVSELPWTASLH